MLSRSSLVSDDTALRGICSRSKTNRRGSAFGVLSVGLLTPVSAPETSWTSQLMSLLESVRARIAHDSGLGDLFAPDALFFHSDTSGAGMLFQPCNYAWALRWLIAFVSKWLGPTHALNITLHSCKATMLSIMNQLLLSKTNWIPSLCMAGMTFGFRWQVRELYDVLCFLGGGPVAPNIGEASARSLNLGLLWLHCKRMGILLPKLSFQLLVHHSRHRPSLCPKLYVSQLRPRQGCVGLRKPRPLVWVSAIVIPLRSPAWGMSRRNFCFQRQASCMFRLLRPIARAGINRPVASGRAILL